MRITASDYEPGYPSQLLTDVTFRNNLFWNVGANFDSYGSGHELFGMANPYGVRMKRIFFIHNTDDNGSPGNSNRAITSFDATGGADESMWFNNVHQDSGYGFFSSTSDNSALNIAAHLTRGNASSWNKNLIVNPNGHTYPAAAIVQSATWNTGVFVDYDGGDFTLKNGNPGKNVATDGSDVGLDMSVLNVATAVVPSRVLGWIRSRSYPPPTPTPVPTPVPTPTPTPVPTPMPTPVPTPLPTPVPTRVPAPPPAPTPEPTRSRKMKIRKVPIGIAP